LQYHWSTSLIYPGKRGSFLALSLPEKYKVWFIYFNHTDPLKDKSSKQYKEVTSKGFNVALEGSGISF